MPSEREQATSNHEDADTIKSKSVKSGVTSICKLFSSRIKRGNGIKRLTTTNDRNTASRHGINQTDGMTTVTRASSTNGVDRSSSRGRKGRNFLSNRQRKSCNKQNKTTDTASKGHNTTTDISTTTISAVPNLAMQPSPFQNETVETIETRNTLSSSAMKVLKSKRIKSLGMTNRNETADTASKMPLTPADLSILTKSSASDQMTLPSPPPNGKMELTTNNSLSSSARELLKNTQRNSSMPPSFKKPDECKHTNEFNADDYIDIAGSRAQLTLKKSSTKSIIRRSKSVEDMKKKSLTRRLHRSSSVVRKKEEREPKTASQHPNETMTASDHHVLTNYDTNASTHSTLEQRQPDSPTLNASPTPILSENNPTKHQLIIPPATQILTHARICSFLSLCTDNTINKFTRLSRLVLEGLQHSSPSQMLSSLLQCGEDVVLEDRFYCPVKEGEGTTVAILRRVVVGEVIVCYCGSKEEQEVCVREKRTQTCLMNDESTKCDFYTGTQVPIHPHFNKTYFSSDVETRLFTRLKEITTMNSISNVVFTGHSFGAALSTIGGVRFAGSHPTLSVSCTLFGAPKVGGVAFRSVAHCLGNLRIIRLEHEHDFSPALPEGPEWRHAGHTITLAIAKLSSIKKNQHKSSSKSHTNIHSAAKGSSSNNPKALVMAYRFDEKRPGRRMSGWNVKMKTKKHDHDISSYVHAIETFTHMGIPWVEKFVGYDVVEEGRNGEEARVPVNDVEARCVI